MFLAEGCLAYTTLLPFLDHIEHDHAFVYFLFIHPAKISTFMISCKMCMTGCLRPIKDLDSLLMIEAQNVNNQVVTSETLKVNETTINNFMFLYFNFGLDSVSPYQNVIYQIASMCPSEGGPAVFRARVLMERVTDTILYNDESVCMQAGYYREHYKVVNEPLITIVPNPASTSILISLLFEHDGLCNVEIYDVTGKELTSESFSCKEKMMYKDVSHLNPGIYYIKVKTDHGIRESTKLVIVR